MEPEIQQKPIDRSSKSDGGIQQKPIVESGKTTAKTQQN